MKIGIIGAGNIGGTLTRRLRALGHDVFVANSRGPETLKDLAKQTGATPVTAREAARQGELVIVTIPMKNVPELPSDLFDGVSNDVVVVDTCNYYPQQRDGRIDAIEGGQTESSWVGERIGRSVIKAFNNIYADHLLKMGRPSGDPKRIALPIAGDDTRAKKIVMQLVDELGFDPIDDGGIGESWRQQPGTPVYAMDYDAQGVRKALRDARNERSREWRARILDGGRQVRELYAALNAQNLELFDSVISDQIEYVDYALDETIKGREAFKKHFKNWWTAFPKGTGEIRNLIVLNDQIVVEVIGRGNQTGPFETKRGIISPTQQTFEFHFCQVFRVKDDRIVSGHSYSDAFKLFISHFEARQAA